jgi:hypothetical protein
MSCIISKPAELLRRMHSLDITAQYVNLFLSGTKDLDGRPTPTGGPGRAAAVEQPNPREREHRKPVAASTAPPVSAAGS